MRPACSPSPSMMLAGLRSRCVIPFWCAAEIGVRHRDPDRQNAFERQAARRQHSGERPSLDQLHREEDGRARVFDGMDSDDVRVVERGHGERLAREALAAIGIRGRDVGQHLEGDLALQPRIARPIDLSHPAGAEQRHDFVRTEPGARVKRHGARFCHEAGAPT